MSTSDRPVFLSYASQDAAAARRICEALRQVGVEVWFDQSELRGGDAWDAKIRRQIKDCALCMPVISANTQARPEGYFRLEWKLAVGALHGTAMNYARMGQFDEALAVLQRAARNPASTALARYQEFLLYFRRAKFQEAEQAVRQSIAVQPSANSQAGLAMVLLTWKGDAEGAAQAVASGPATFRNEHRILWISALVHLARQAPEDALKVMDRLSDDFIRDNWFVAPKAYWVGMAHRVANRPEAARVAWEAGLGVVETRLKVSPDKQDLHLILGELLAWLGREQEALRELKTVNELSRGTELSWNVSPVRIYAALGRVDEALPILQYQLTRGNADVGWPLTPTLLRRDPIWGKLRGDPRLQKLVADAEAGTISATPTLR